MTKDQLNLEETKEMFISVAKKMVKSKDILTEADQKIGDGDHGVNMARGFEAVIQKIEENTFTSIG